MPRSGERQAARLRLIGELEPQLSRAIAGLSAMRSQGVRPSKIKFRSDFFCGDGGLSSPPPIVRVCAPRGINLQLYMLLIFEAQCRRRSGFPGASEMPISSPEPQVLTWERVSVSRARSNAAVRVSERQNRERQIRSAFTRLSEEGLVERVWKSRKAYTVTPLHEAGRLSGAYPYSVPSFSERSTSVIGIDPNFFTKGWVFLLSQSEIRLYLALCHLAAIFPEAHAKHGVYCAGSVRFRYGIARDVYESHEMLSKFGLIERVNNPARHLDGKLKDFDTVVASGDQLPAHRFRVHSDVLAIPAKRRTEEALRYVLRDKGMGL